MLVAFELDGQEFVALNGGPHFKFTDAVSLAVDCKTQAEVDEYTDKLTADGGQLVQCGWVTDKFGVAWQLVPSIIPELMSDSDPAASDRIMAAVMRMKKIEIEAVKRAYEGGA